MRSNNYFYLIIFLAHRYMVLSSQFDMNNFQTDLFDSEMGTY